MLRIGARAWAVYPWAGINVIRTTTVGSAGGVSVRWVGGLVLGLLLALSPVWALSPELAGRIAAGDSDERLKALSEAVIAADPGLPGLLQALLADEVKVAGGKAFIVRDGKAVDAATGAAATLPEGAEDVVNNNRMRRELESAQAALRLFSPDRSQRAKAIAELKDQADEEQAGADRQGREAQRPTPSMKAALAVLRAAMLIASPRQGQAAGRREAAGRQRASRRRARCCSSAWRPPARPMPRCAPR
jgi:urea transport system permease protein